MTGQNIESLEVPRPLSAHASEVHSHAARGSIAGWLPLLAASPLFVIQCVIYWGEIGQAISLLLILASLLLWWTRWPGRDVDQKAARSGSLGTVLLSAISMLLVAIGLVLYLPSLGALGFCVAILAKGLAASRTSQQSADQWKLGVLLTVVVVGPAATAYFGSAHLQARAESLASYFFDLAGLHHQLLNGVIYLANDQYYVLQLCWGVDAWSFFLGLSAFIATLHRMNWMQMAFFLVASYAWAVLFDAGRIFGKVFCASRIDMALDGSMVSTFIDVAIGFALFLLMYSAYHILRFLLNPIPEPSRAVGANKGFYNPYSGVWNKLLVSPIRRLNPRTSTGEQKSGSKLAFSRLLIANGCAAGLLLVWQLAAISGQLLGGSTVVYSPDQVEHARVLAGVPSAESTRDEEVRRLHDLLQCVAAEAGGQSEVEAENMPGHRTWDLATEVAAVEMTSDFPYREPFSSPGIDGNVEYGLLTNSQLHGSESPTRRYILSGDDDSLLHVLEKFVSSAGGDEIGDEGGKAHSFLAGLPLAQNPFLRFLPVESVGISTTENPAPLWARIQMIHRAKDPIPVEEERYLETVFEQMLVGRCSR
ncbi:archaeosortase/exosortase family protein [Rubinisphaera sp. JC750]|uniref:archaeosortase/exosortase family protein n=1 Tax=Rubinisphaera sp. JC750 TaxID=2898658 RepID=UPI001F2C7C96|nr:archaeosortase/exosortase family protein [Rubinisphaera sp. JC750]